jgi:ADP-heptose:LPS heptosyltransferase
MKNIAIVCANGLGDGLLSLAIANNLQCYGYKVTTFSNYLVQLRLWFPEKQIESFPMINQVNEVLSSYDKIISTDGAFLTKVQHGLGDKYKIFYEHEFDRSKTILQNFLNICQSEFGLSTVTQSNGIAIPAGLHFRKFIRRVIIHPMSACKSKNWLPKKFIKLAKELEQKHFEPVFIMSPQERSEWMEILQDRFSLPLFATIDSLARFIYESGFMIGNDSGIGHLASNLGIPTLSLFARKSVSNLWRPEWGKGQVVTPTFQLPGARLRTKYWKNFLTVNKVLSSFNKLTFLLDKHKIS